MRRLFIAMLAAAVLIGCATTGKYQRVLSSWVGGSEIDLVRSWGAPQQVYETGGVRFITYVKGGNVHVPAVAPTYQTTYIGNTAYTNAVGGAPAQNIQLSCQTTFEVRDGIITSWRWQGNNCVSN